MEGSTHWRRRTENSGTALLISHQVESRYYGLMKAEAEVSSQPTKKHAGRIFISSMLSAHRRRALVRENVSFTTEYSVRYYPFLRDFEILNWNLIIELKFTDYSCRMLACVFLVPGAAVHTFSRVMQLPLKWLPSMMNSTPSVGRFCNYSTDWTVSKIIFR